MKVQVYRLTDDFDVEKTILDAIEYKKQTVVDLTKWHTILVRSRDISNWITNLPDGWKYTDNHIIDTHLTPWYDLRDDMYIWLMLHWS